MPGWLQSLLNFFGGGLQLIWNTILNVISVVYNNLAGTSNAIVAYCNALAADIRQLSAEFSRFVGQNYNTFVRWVDAEFAAFSEREARDFAQLVGDINTLAHRTTQNITVVQQQESSALAALIKWIISTIFGPLSDLIGRALNWIENEGAWLYSLLTDLEKLADLIMVFLWSGWLVLFRKFAPAIVSYILKNWKSIMPGIMSVLEDIISSSF